MHFFLFTNVHEGDITFLLMNCCIHSAIIEYFKINSTPIRWGTERSMFDTLISPLHTFVV